MDNKTIDDIIKNNIYNHFFNIVDIIFSMKCNDPEIQKIITEFCTMNNINIIEPKKGSEFNEKTMKTDKYNGDCVQEVKKYGYRVNNEISRKAEVELCSSN